MLGEAIKKRLEQRPFEPFRLLITSGEHVDIRHPEMAILTRYSVAVGHGGREGIAEYVLEYSLIHIVEIGPLNGHHRRNGDTARPRRRK